MHFTTFKKTNLRRKNKFVDKLKIRTFKKYNTKLKTPCPNS